MTEQILRHICESKHRTLIVITGTFAIGLLLILPLVDVYYAGIREKEELFAELESARRVAAEITPLQKRMAEKQAQVARFEARTVNEQSLQMLRERLLALAKETGCSIRRLNVGDATSRPWTPGEDLIGPSSATKRGDAKAACMLEWRPVAISLSGTSTGLRTVLERMLAEGHLMHTKSFEMYPSSPNRQTKTLDLELWYFSLARREGWRQRVGSTSAGLPEAPQ